MYVLYSTQLLHANADLDLLTVFLLDKVQKKEVISKENFAQLKKQKIGRGKISKYLCFL